MAASCISDQENFDNSDSEDDDDDNANEGNDGQKKIIIHETDGNLYHKKDLAASFLSNQETLLSIVGKPEDDIMNSGLKQFSDFCNQDNEIRGEPASNDETM